MPMSGSGKRKRADRQYSQDDFSRPSPHRPTELDLGRSQHRLSSSNSRDGSEIRGRGYRRGSRGGRGTFHISSPQQSSNLEPQSSVRPVVPVAIEPSHSRADMVVADQINVGATALLEPQMERIYHYDYVDEQVQNAWAESGYAVIAGQLKDFIQHHNDIGLTTLVQEIIKAVCDQGIPAHDAGSIVKDSFLEDTEDIDLAHRGPHIICDAVSVVFEENTGLTVGPLVQFLVAAGISEEVLRLELDQPLLLRIGLISGRFKQMGIRKQTNTLYRQANFNLMREESEGFAKLITELFTTSGNELPTGEVVHETVERVKAMIGAFDLDVGRSLDVVLDVFGSVLVRHNRFLVKLLRASPWWPDQLDQQFDQPPTDGGLPRWAAPEISDYQLSDLDREQMAAFAKIRDARFWPEAQASGILAFQQVGRMAAPPQAIRSAQEAPENDWTSQWISQTHTMPAHGNRDAAQLLGFKLRFYSSSAARNPQDILPDNLIHLSALLIKIGFISLADLYPHIWRSDEEMEELRQQKQKEKTEREIAARPGAGVKNALALAGALADDTLPAPVARLRDTATRSSTPSRDTETDKSKEPAIETADQKVMLLKSLLAIGALPEALFILGRFPWIMDLCPELPEYVNRILHYCLSEVYEDLRPLRSRDSLIAPKPQASVDATGASKGQVRLLENPHKKILKWAGLDRNDSGDGIDYRFYWDDWSDNIPVCRSVDDVFTLCDTLLTLVGVKIGQDPILVLRLARIGKYSLLSDNSDKNKKRWLDLIKRYLLPSLSLTKSNAGVVNEVFELISYYPTLTRYLMYMEWSSGRTSRNPDVASAFDLARAETKDILKRISKTNVKPMARSLAKVAYANPHIVITTALAQIEVYDSIAEVFVEGARYFTDLGYDVLTWALINSMGRTGRSRTQDGGIFASRWLSALSQFSGKIYKRYSMMKAGPVLQYVAEQLSLGNTTDLKMLEQLVVGMAGIATDTNFNDSQLQAMGGGSLLQSQTILQLLDRRNDSKTTSKRLIKSLQENSLTAKMLVLIAQQRQSCVFDDRDVPLKAIGNTFDELTRVLNQYVDMLRANLTTEEFESSIPDVVQLLVKFELPPEIAFGIQRPIVARKMAEVDKEVSESQKAVDLKSLNEDVEMDDQDASEEDGEAEEQDDTATTTANTPSEIDINGESDVVGRDTTEQQSKWHPTLLPIMEALGNYLPQDIDDVIGLGFYVTFWQLSLYDISVPSKSYEDEMNRQRRKIAAVTADRTNVSASGARAREANVKQYQTIIDELLKENKHHLKAHNESRTRLTQEKEQWFLHKGRQQDVINNALMEYCFLPRITSSPLDAYFCFKFVKYLHVNSTPNFRTLGFYDRLLRADRLTSLIFMCTSNESDNLGRFLRELLHDLNRWHKDQKIYEREAFGSKRNLIGFAIRLDNGKPSVLLDFEAFRRILYKWHSGIFMALNKCLSSTEYMHARNAISVLRSISVAYPVVNYHGTSLQKAVDKLRKSGRDDLQVAAGALLGALHQREKDWVAPPAFRQGREKDESEATAIHTKDDAPVSYGADTLPTAEPTGDQAKTEIVKEKVSSVKTELQSRPVSRAESSVTEPSRHVVTNTPSASSGTERESTHADRRAHRANEHSHEHDLPRRPSPARSAVPVSLPSRPDTGVRNGYRDSPKSLPRPPPNDAVRLDNRSGHSRGPNQENLYEQPHRPMRSNDWPGSHERDERLQRRAFDSRQTTERRPEEKEARNERDLRIERDVYRGGERDLHLSDRGHGRLQPEDRKRPDISDDRRQPSSVQNRIPNAQQPTASINPERAALIGVSEQRSDISIRGSAQDRSRGSRHSSPPREDDRRLQSRHERDDHTDRHTDLTNRTSLTGQQPNNQRNHVPSYTSREQRLMPQDAIDMRHGRLEPESPQRSSSRPERTSEAEVPSGPRAKGTANPSRTRTSTGLGQNAPPASDRSTPTGPARSSRGNPVPEPPKQQDTVGVHPDRMNQIAHNDASRASRSSQMGLQIAPPSGPRSAAPPPPSGPSPTSRNLPVGPQSDGNGRNRRNPLDTLNNQLAQAQGPPQGRGRGSSRQSNGPPPPPMAPPSSAPRSYNQSDPLNPNGLPVQPRPSSSRRDSHNDNRIDEEARHGRSSKDRDGRGDRRVDEPRRSDRREESRDKHPTREVMHDDSVPRKHPRDDNMHYGGYPRGGPRFASDNKRARRGG